MAARRPYNRPEYKEVLDAIEQHRTLRDGSAPGIGTTLTCTCSEEAGTGHERRVALRVAVQQYLVFDLDFVRPFERTEKGWIFVLSHQQGF